MFDTFPFDNLFRYVRKVVLCICCVSLVIRKVSCVSCIYLVLTRRAVVSYWRKYVHEVLVNRLGGLSLPRKSVVRLTDRPDMTLDVYRGRKTTMQQLTTDL